MPRSASLLPSATEIVCALGASDQLCAVSHECDYPKELAQERIDGGLKAVLNCIDLEALPEEWLGRSFGPGLLHDLEALNQQRSEVGLSLIDTCGEIGGFQSFVHSLPGMAQTLRWNFSPLRRTLIAGRFRSAGFCAPGEG